MNQSDTAYFDYLLMLAAMDGSKNSNPVTVPAITPYDPVYYPTHSTPMFPDITTFNFVDRMFDFDFALSSSTNPTSQLNGAFPDSSNRHEDVPQNVVSLLPENAGSILDSESVFRNRDHTLSLFSIPHTSEPPSSKPNSEHAESGSKAPKKKRVVSKPRPRRAALGLSYSSFEKRLQILTEDPFVLAIMEDENKVHCSGCEKNIQLDNRRRRSLHLQNWKTHKGRCAGIVDKHDRHEMPVSDSERRIGLLRPHDLGQPVNRKWIA